ncbi:MAG: hypothetical protein WCO98_04235 [bacterium]
MKKQAGLWVDHRKAVIVFITNKTEELKVITSDVENNSGVNSEKDTVDDMRDRQYENHLNNYFDKIIDAIRDAESFLIFGPGEAKGELEKRIELEGLAERIIAIETNDKMTDNQIIAKVRERFLV